VERWNVNTVGREQLQSVRSLFKEKMEVQEMQVQELFNLESSWNTRLQPRIAAQQYDDDENELKW